MFNQEFHGRSREYYENAFRAGKLRVEGPKKKKAPEIHMDTPLLEGIRMRHLIHRHEPPVPNVAIEIIEADDDYVVVNKPAGIPVHTGGQYRKNTVHGILEAEHSELGELSPVHRLDKPVSGVLIFSRHKDAADRMRAAITSGETQKLYIARVMGHMTEDCEVDAPLYFDYDLSKAVIGIHGKDLIYTEENEEKSDSQVLKRRRTKAERVEARRREAGSVRDEKIFRPSKTIFRVISHAKDGKTTLVECQPITGRTHQIRAHLAHIGFPIANDVTYGGTYGHVYTSTTDLAKNLGLTRKLDEPSNDVKTAYACSEAIRVDVKIPGQMRDPLCPHCPYYVARDYPVDLTPLWLHAQTYSICGNIFKASYPEWAKDGFH